MRLAIFGGTFDPDPQRAPGDGPRRRRPVSSSTASCSFRPRTRRTSAARPTRRIADRVRMVELACAGDPRFEVSRLEEFTERSYSIDTIEKVRASLAPEDELFFMIGADAFAEIRTWHRWRDVVRAVRFIVVSRPGGRYDAPAGIRMDRLDSVDMPVSSSQIRAALAAGESPSEVPRGCSPTSATTACIVRRYPPSSAILVAVRYTHCVTPAL